MISAKLNFDCVKLNQMDGLAAFMPIIFPLAKIGEMNGVIKRHFLVVIRAEDTAWRLGRCRLVSLCLRSTRAVVLQKCDGAALRLPSNLVSKVAALVDCEIVQCL